MRKRNARPAGRPEPDEQGNPVRRKLFFQQLPPEVQMVILQGVKLRLSREPRPGDLGLLDLDDLLDEEADDHINRHNIRRTIQGWLEFAGEGEQIE